MGYIFVVYESQNTTSCGLRDSLQNFDVHNLFIGGFADSTPRFLLIKKEGMILFYHLPLFVKVYKTGFSLLRITLLHFLADYLL